MCVRKFWILYWLAALLLSIGSILMRCWEDGGLQNLKWWTGLHLAGWLLLSIVIWLLARGPLRGLLDRARRKIESNG